MDDSIWWTFCMTLLVASEVVVRGHGIEDLATVRQVRLQCKDAKRIVWEGNEVEIEDLRASISP